MSESILKKQLHRQLVLQERLPASQGKIVTKKETKAAKHLEEEALQGSVAQNTSSAVVLESDVSKRIVTMRQKNDTTANLDAAMEVFREDRIEEGLVDTRAVRNAAERLYSKGNHYSQALKAERARRATNGPAKMSKLKAVEAKQQNKKH